MRLINFLSEPRSYFTILVTTIIVSIFSYQYVIKLPKPETFIELLKYYFSSPGEYLFGTVLFIVSAFLLGITSLSGAKIILTNWEYLNLFTKILSVVLNIVLLIASFYFIFYFFKVLGTILIIAVVAIVVIKALDN